MGLTLTVSCAKSGTHSKKLRMRIAKAVRERKHGKAKALRWLLPHSYSAKLLAIRRVTSDKGRYTPGVDSIVWNTNRQKIATASQLNRRGYPPPG
ncbi:reverse transcriptase N-terminal domain-containing protein [Desulfonema ishimotonii]|uniref:reverse transcriptase N-terminal domain-containing protein n=1 Tax=Desulfonema ishimotonii TaxID=45657 RepID=UPI0022B17698